MDDPRIKRLEQELDYAVNQARKLRDRLLAVVPQASEPGRFRAATIGSGSKV
jgi:hypothetical protein